MMASVSIALWRSLGLPCSKTTTFLLITHSGVLSIFCKFWLCKTIYIVIVGILKMPFWVGGCLFVWVFVCFKMLIIYRHLRTESWGMEIYIYSSGVLH